MEAEQLTLPISFLNLMEAGEGVNHHLRQKESGLWQLKITVDRGRKYVGQRVTLALDTRDLNEARVRRDLILLALRVAGKVRG